MRITNSMIRDRILFNTNRNAMNVDKMYNQSATGKKIQRASENPVLATNILRFQTSIRETEQYKRNADQAESWMNTSDESIKSMLDIMKKLHSQLVQGSTDTLTAEDRDMIVTEMRQLADQIGAQMNGTYAGRYIFSGNRTDEQPVITENEMNALHDITQNFVLSDMHQTKAYIKDVSTEEPQQKNLMCLI